MTAIPFVDLTAQYHSIKPEIDEAIQSVIDRRTFVLGSDSRDFEVDYAAFCEAKACAGVGNGTDALHLALRALGVGPGDEVVTVAHTFIATAEAITMAGARPVFVDVLPDTLLMDPALLEKAITPRTKAVIPVHLYGQPCDMTAIGEVARRHNLKVLEDAAQAHGARWRGKRTGTLGDAATFSFFPGKNLGAYGDAGAVVSEDEALIERVRMLSNHGRLGTKYMHDVEGFSSRLDGIQANVLRVKLRYMDEWNAARRRHAAAYDAALADLPLRLPVTHPDAETVWHLYVVRTPHRDEVRAQLEAKGIRTGIHYPVPLHLQPAYQHLGIAPGSLPVTEVAANEVLSLPMYPELTSELIEEVVAAVRDALAVGSR